MSVGRAFYDQQIALHLIDMLYKGSCCQVGNGLLLNSFEIDSKWSKLLRNGVIASKSVASELTDRCQQSSIQRLFNKTHRGRQNIFRSLFPAAIYYANYFSAPTKFVSLSLIILTGLPLRAMNRIIAFRQLSVSSFVTISICNARTVSM